MTLTCELLESRLLLSNFADVGLAELGQAASASDFHAVIVAGDPNGSPTDSPELRVDANTPTSPFAGVGSLRISAKRGTYICSGTPFDATHVLTAGHCIDLNNDGKSNLKDGITSITFNLNLDTDAGTDLVDVAIAATSWQTHPDFTGFARPSVNDDLAVITLGGSGVPADVPTYSLVTSDMVAGTTHLYLVGYGRSGDGVNGYTTGASFTVKRDGENMVDAFYGQDDARRAAANEVFRFDFDGPSGNGTFGGPTLGNDKETQLGGGDSGGPSFVVSGDPSLASSYRIAGVDTFTQGSTAPKFGSLGGGINVYPYAAWILGPHAASSSSGGGGGGSSAALAGAGSDEEAVPGEADVAPSDDRSAFTVMDPPVTSEADVPGEEDVVTVSPSDDRSAFTVIVINPTVTITVETTVSSPSTHNAAAITNETVTGLATTPEARRTMAAMVLLDADDAATVDLAFFASSNLFGLLDG